MEPQDKLKHLIDKAQISTTSETDNKILADALDLLGRRSSTSSGSILVRLLCSGTTRLVAAALLIALGFLAARLTTPAPLDAQQLRAAIEESLSKTISDQVSQQVDSKITAQFAAGSDQLKTELQQNFRQDLTEFATQTLTETKTLTDQRLTELVQLIEDARRKDRMRIEKALEQIEQNRIYDKLRLASGIQNLSASANTLNSPTEQIQYDGLFDAKRNHQ